MPLFYQNQINEFTKLAVWKIMEPEEFFLQKVTLQKEITHPHKRLQHLAGRYLLQFLAPDFPLRSLHINDSRKPVLADNSYYFSISHCADFAAAVVSTKTNVGIDVELVNSKIEKLQNKFLGDKELNLIRGISSDEQHVKYLTMFWSCKEAMFKWYGKGSVDFIKNMTIEGMNQSVDGGFLQTTYRNDRVVSLNPEFLFFQDLCLVWVVH